MKKINNFVKKVLVCLLTVFCVGANYTMVSNAAELEGSVVAVIEIESYTIDGGMIEAGKEITVNFNLHNASNNINASSVMMTLTNSTGSIYPAYGNSNQIYVGNIAAGSSKEVSVPMVIGDAFMGNAVDLNCQFEYVSQNLRQSNSAIIVIPTSGGSTIGVKSIDVSSHAIVNGKSLLAFSYVNQSSSNITDAKLIVDGAVSSTSKEIGLDTVYAGKSYTQDFYVIFTEPGNQQVNVKLQYTDVDGSQSTTDLGTFDVTVSKESVEDNSGNGITAILDIVGKAVAAVVGIAALASIIVYVKKKVF